MYISSANYSIVSPYLRTVLIWATINPRRCEFLYASMTHSGILETMASFRSGICCPNVGKAFIARIKLTMISSLNKFYMLRA